MEGPNLDILKAWVGSEQHREVLVWFRQELIAHLAAFAASPWEPQQIQQIHMKVRTLLELLVTLRLDNIDVQVLAKDAVSQFESQLPTRLDFTKTYSGEAAGT